MKSKKRNKKPAVRKIKLDFVAKISTEFFAYDTERENRAAIKALIDGVRERIKDEFHYMTLHNADLDCANRARTSVKLAKVTRLKK